jgi:hypothetical protein
MSVCGSFVQYGENHTNLWEWAPQGVKSMYTEINVLPIMASVETS